MSRLTQPMKRRVILHIDMNSFYASVEMAYDHSIKGKPVAIAGNPEERRGIIVTSSYEARAKGVKTTMTVWQAKKLCPELIVRRPNFDRYRAASSEIFKRMAEITPLVEPISIDEGYMDITDVKNMGSPIEIAENLQKKILNELDLPCSIGIAPNKFMAKMGSDMKKPFGITILRKRELPQTLWPMPIEEMYGVGAKTAEKLRSIDVKTIGDLAVKDVYALRSLLGVNGERLKNRSNGIDNREVDPDAIYDFKSIGSSETLPHDTTNIVEIRNLMSKLTENIEKRIKRKETVCKTVQITIRYHDRETITRSKTVDNYIEDKEEILQIAAELFDRHWNLEPIRLLGVTAQNLIEKRYVGEQLNLFTYHEKAKKEKLYKTMDQLTEKYGESPFKQLNQSKEKEQIFKTSFQKDFLSDYRK